MVELPLINRCGSCTACCTLLEVPSLQKPAHTPCQHLCHEGCGIYSNRPAECAKYHCYWLYNQLQIEFRPDQLGIVVDLAESKIGPVVLVSEVVENAFDAKRAQDFVAQIALGHKAFICLDRGGGGPKQILFPPWVAHLESRVAELVQSPEHLLSEEAAAEEAAEERAAVAQATRASILQERQALLEARKKAKGEKKKRKKLRFKSREIGKNGRLGW